MVCLLMLLPCTAKAISNCSINSLEHRGSSDPHVVKPTPLAVGDGVGAVHRAGVSFRCLFEYNSAYPYEHSWYKNHSVFFNFHATPNTYPTGVNYLNDAGESGIRVITTPALEACGLVFFLLRR